MNYDPNKRQASPADNDVRALAIKVNFAIPVFISQSQQSRLADLIEDIARNPKNVPAGGIHWQSECGAEPHWSEADAIFLGIAPEAGAPAKGEPTFDDDVLFFGTSCRQAYDSEIRREAHRKAQRETIEKSGLKRGADLIAKERQRQITKEGWTHEHDDMHGKGEMADAAIVYADAAQCMQFGTSKADLEFYYNSKGSRVRWPWAPEWLKICDNPVRNLVKAGALIAAEIDRLQRKQILDAVFKPLEPHND